jgi:hypothetical protein
MDESILLIAEFQNNKPDGTVYIHFLFWSHVSCLFFKISENVSASVAETI